MLNRCVFFDVRNTCSHIYFQDQRQRDRIEALNSLTSYTSGLAAQLADKDAMGGKLSNGQMKTIQEAIKSTNQWVDEHSETASKEDIEEKLAGAS